MSFGCFVTGTDTGVGKTFVACAMLRALARRHARVVGMKPVAAGAVSTAHGLDSEDAVALRAASTITVPPELDNPVLLREAVSPHLAAAHAGRAIDLDPLVRCQRALARQCDALVVEGAGGFLVPLTPSLTGADLARAFGLPIVLVVGLRLGCLNHALLTAEAIASRGLALGGWVANRIDPALQAADENVNFLRARLGAPLIADVAHGADGIEFDWPAAWQ
jgi:dethiobiotin synthetase